MWKVDIRVRSSRKQDNSKLNLKEIDCDAMDLIHRAQDSDQWRPLIYAVMNLWVP
jgi:hypothetical protein